MCNALIDILSHQDNANLLFINYDELVDMAKLKTELYFDLLNDQNNRVHDLYLADAFLQITREFIDDQPEFPFFWF